MTFLQSTWKHCGLHPPSVTEWITGFLPTTAHIGSPLNQTQPSISNTLGRNWSGRQRSLVQPQYLGGLTSSMQPNTSQVELGFHLQNRRAPKSAKSDRCGLQQPNPPRPLLFKFQTMMVKHGNLQRTLWRLVFPRMVQGTCFGMP